MPIIPSDLVFYKSTNGLGGAITPNEVPDGAINALFDGVNSEQAANGHIDYRCMYIANENTLITLQNTFFYTSVNTPSTNTDMAIGIGTSSAGGIEQTISTETKEPVGVFFSSLVGEDAAQFIGNIPGNSWKAVWLRRTVTAGATALVNDGGNVVIKGDTTA